MFQAGTHGVRAAEQRSTIVARVRAAWVESWGAMRRAGGGLMAL